MEMMKRFPKCYWIWNHRRWCLETLDETKNADWNRELAIVLKVLMMDSRNFHGWQYRRYVVSHLEQEARLKEPHSGSELEISLREFQYTTETINKSTANFSAWHNRTKLIAKILKLLSQENLGMASADEKAAGVFQSTSKLLKHELNLVKTGMFMDAEDTSVWLYMQWLLTDKIFVGALPKDLYRELLQQQLKDVNELNDLEKDDTGRDNVWCLKTIIFLKTLLSRESDENDLSEHIIDNDVTAALNKLVELDPLRKGHYIDQLNGRAAIIC
ncbi:geranylgeranyl transferase type-2 subunit alpha [Metschnikowia aff. pulcherrima]|uniref:Geranylgeranyl transferase type-2 subunit alpha n=1 Tax=Metschnikowia aff. pulcherrima TaxID=2163413 RepID=A0A4P6XKX7_9ASCO|nr:geranylgeranyl transferase type-2 subunit alpha [Metschnikowia aff. pulcherrima]